MTFDALPARSGESSPLVLPVLRPDWPASAQVQALCTTRAGGVSQAPFDSLNLGLHVQDNAQAVMHNRALLQQHCGARPVFLSQVHGTDVAHIDALTTDGLAADACWSDHVHLACTIMVADCLPVLFTDRRGQVVAAAHAGWRGLAAGVLENTLRTLCEAAHCDPSEVLAWLGPCIGPHAFEVGEDVLRAFDSSATLTATTSASETFFRPTGQAVKWWADLAALARWRLRLAGITQLYGNDSTETWCTVTQSQRFFSYRRDGRTGRFAVCIWRSL